MTCVDRLVFIGPVVMTGAVGATSSKVKLRTPVALGSENATCVAFKPCKLLGKLELRPAEFMIPEPTVTNKTFAVSRDN